MCDSLRFHRLQPAGPPCPSLSPGVGSDSCPLSQWCHPTISSSAIPFCSCLQSFPASGSFAMSQLFASGGQSIGASASASILSKNTQNWPPLVWTGWISLQSKGLSRVFSNATARKHQFFSTQLSLWSSSHICTHFLIFFSIMMYHRMLDIFPLLYSMNLFILCTCELHLLIPNSQSIPPHLLSPWQSQACSLYWWLLFLLHR